jgi:RNA polymerase sigma-70 factor (ECF subfamily)
LSEEQLINEIKNNPDLFGSVYDEHYHTIFNYCYKRTKDFNVSKDITSETFLKAFLNIKKFKWKGVSLLSWLYRIATNEINLHYRSKKYRPSLLNEIDSSYATMSREEDLPKEEDTTEQELEKHEEFIKMQKVVGKLPLKYQEVITLKYFEKLKIKEIRSILNKPEGTIKSLLSRGIYLLKQQL